MKGIMTAISCLMAMTCAAFGSALTVSEPATVSFSVPFPCDDARGRGSLCLADKFETSRQVVLINETEICRAKTSETFVEDYPNGKADTATRLMDSEKCFSKKPGIRERWSFRVAVVGVFPEGVRLISPDSDQSPVAKDLESKARRLAAPLKYLKEDPQESFSKTKISYGLSDAPPRALRTGNIALLIFGLQQEGSEAGDGPIVLTTNSEVFLLVGSCAHGPFFFSVNERLYLAYSATVSCFDCGDTQLFVYDLSASSPKLVYHNDKFSD